MGENSLIIDTGINTDGFKAGSESLKNAIKSFGNSAKTSMKSISNSGRGVLRTIMKWGPALLGVSGAYQIISKATSTFLAQNQQLSSQLSACWTSLGNVLGPIITQLVNWITTVVSYFLTFLRLLGVTNKSASQLSKAGNAAAGGANALRKSLLGFDELNLLQDNSGGGGGGGGASLPDLDPPAWMKELVDLIKNKKWTELGEFISEAIIKGLDKVADYINKVPWKKIGDAIRQFFLGIEWEGIADAIFNVLKAAWNGALDLFWGLLAGDTEEEPPIISALRRLGEALEELYKAAKVIVKATIDVIKELFGIAVNDVLPILIEKLAEAIKKVAKFIQEHGPLIKTFMEALVGWFVGKKIAEGILGAVKAFELLGKGVSAAFSLIAAHPIAALIMLIVGALIYLYNTSEPFRNWCNEIWEHIKNLYDWFKQFFEMLKTDPKEAFSFLGSSILDALRASLGDGLLGELKILLFDPFVNIINMIKGFFGIESPSRLMIELGTYIIQGLIEGLNGLWDLLTEWFSTMWDNFTEEFHNLEENARKTGSNIVNKFMTSLNTIWGSLNGWLSNVFSSFSRTFSNLASSALQWGQHLVQNLINGIRAKLGSLRSIASEGASIISGLLGHSKPKEGPLKNDDQWGYHMVENFIEGIDGSMPKLQSAVTSLAESARLDKAFSGFGNIAESMQDIAGNVAFAKPAMAMGAVTPYSVNGNVGNTHVGYDSEISLADVVNSINSLKAYMNTLDDKDSTISLNVYLDGRQLEAAVTRRQERTLKAKGLA